MWLLLSIGLNLVLHATPDDKDAAHFQLIEDCVDHLIGDLLPEVSAEQRSLFLASKRGRKLRRHVRGLVKDLPEKVDVLKPHLNEMFTEGEQNLRARRDVWIQRFEAALAEVVDRSLPRSIALSQLHAPELMVRLPWARRSRNGPETIARGGHFKVSDQVTFHLRPKPVNPSAPARAFKPDETLRLPLDNDGRFEVEGRTFRLALVRHENLYTEGLALGHFLVMTTVASAKPNAVAIFDWDREQVTSIGPRSFLLGTWPSRMEVFYDRKNGVLRFAHTYFMITATDAAYRSLFGTLQPWARGDRVLPVPLKSSTINGPFDDGHRSAALNAHWILGPSYKIEVANTYFYDFELIRTPTAPD